MTSVIVAVYADGGVIRSNPSPIGGTWAWCQVDEANQRVRCDSGVYPTNGAQVTNNQAEYIALCKALAALPAGWTGTVYCDSLVTIGRLFRLYGNSGIPDAWVTRARQLVKRLGRVETVLLQGHPTRAELLAGVGSKGLPVSEHNVWCDQACTEAGRLYLAKCAA
jgi:ribonuclease HI